MSFLQKLLKRIIIFLIFEDRMWYFFVMKLKSKPIIKKIARIVHQNDPDAEIILFGSRARGDERPDSD